MNPPAIICPACGSDKLEPLAGTSFLCENCGHWFRVINGQTLADEDEEGDDEAEG